MAVLTSEHPDVRIRVMAGLVTGFIAGVVMAVPMMLYDVVISARGIFFPANVIATWAGLPIEMGFGMHTIVGVMIHLVFSALLGALWGLAFTKTPTVMVSAILGFAYGLLVYWVVEYLAAPVMNPLFGVLTRGVPFLLAHLVFGFLFIIYPTMVGTFRQRVFR